jgi:hypothetical protein
MKQYTKSGAESFTKGVKTLIDQLQVNAGMDRKEAMTFVTAFYHGAANDPVEDLTVRTIKVR